MLSKRNQVIVVTLLVVQFIGITYLFYGRRPGTLVEVVAATDDDTDVMSTPFVAGNSESSIELHLPTQRSNNERKASNFQVSNGGLSKLTNTSSANMADNKEPGLNKEQSFDKSQVFITPQVAEIYRRLKNVQTMPLHNHGRMFEKGTFCHDFLINTFPDPVPVCGQTMTPSDSIRCYGNGYDPTHMATCTLENLVLRHKNFNAEEDIKDIVYLLDDQNTTCPNPTSNFIKKKLEVDDYMNKFIQKVVQNRKGPSSVCDHWIDKITFFFTAQKYHIYFRFLDFYNVHKSLWDHNVTSGDFLVVRVSNGYQTRFPPQDDQLLFPEAMTLEDLPDGVLCFKKVVLVPRTFSSILFRCKMNPRISSKCFKCDAKGLTGTPFNTFRERVLKGCSVDDTISQPKQTLSIMSRTPYLRHPWDKLDKFQRVLTNENELVDGLKRTFPSANVSVIHPEQFSLCDQVRYSNQASALLGVHGAGMVHIWWLKEDALAFELEPTFQTGNPTFRMLSTLAGRRYHRMTIRGNSAKVSVDVGQAMKELKQKLQS